MIILFLDDQDIRHEAAERHLRKDHVMLHAFTADEALEIVSAYNDRIGLAMLDHDLQDFSEVDGRKIERHGVYFLNKMFADIPQEKWPARFVVHSYNPVGVGNMMADLRRMNQTCSAMSFSGDMLRELSESIRPQ